MENKRTQPARPPRPERWDAKPFLSALLRIFIFLAPTAASLLVAVILARHLPIPTDGLSTTGWWVTILGSSFAALFLVQRSVHKLTPLALLLGLTLTFPDHAPSRFGVARQSGNLAELRARLQRAGESGDDGGLQQAAETILALAAALNTHDRHTRGHSERVRVFADMLAEELKIPVAERDRLRWAALLHDVGKLEVPAEILNKAEALGDEEWKLVRQHPSMGMRLIEPLVSWLGPEADTIAHHHERYDGDGYPNGVEGEEISLGGRIVAVADAYDTMTASRPYQKPVSAAAAREELSRCAGKQFDPVVVRAMMDISLGRLWWRVGILSWLAQIPILSPASRFVGRSMPVATGSASAAVVAAVLAVSGIAAPPPAGPGAGGTESYELAEAALPLNAPRSTPGHDNAPRARDGDRAAATDPAPSDPSSVAPTAEMSGSGTTGEGGGHEENGDPTPGEDQSGAEQTESGGSEDDPSLIRQVVETVEEVIDRLPPGTSLG